MNDKEKIQKEIEKIEQEMLSPDFWNDKNLAQQQIKTLQELKDSLLGFGKYDRGNAIVTIFAGVGGEDAEDWVRMLYDMYSKYAAIKNFEFVKIHENQNDNGGYKTITFEINGKNAYLNLKNESGTHRLVRISPFNANGKRQTSFAMVEVLPEIEDQKEIEINPDDIEIENTKSSGPGGQNVNKRETAVRIKHKPTNLSVFVSAERSQQQNREKAMAILLSKLYTIKQAEKKQEKSDLSISSSTSAEWGSQIRSYILHPYKLVKDHRNNVETANVEKVLSGEIDIFNQNL